MVIAAEFVTKIALLMESCVDCLLNCFQMSHFIVPVFKRQLYRSFMAEWFWRAQPCGKLKVIKRPKISSNSSV